MPRHSSSDRVKALVTAQRAPLDEIADCQCRREGVAELDNTERRDNGDKTEEIGDGGSDDKCDGPVDGYDDGPQNLAVLRSERREMEEIHEDVVVEDLNADVAVETGGDDAGYDGEHVASGLPAVGGNALIGDLIDVSAGAN